LSSNEEAEVSAYIDFMDEGIIDSPLFYEKAFFELENEEEYAM